MWKEATDELRKYIVENILDGRDAGELTADSPLLEWGIIDSLTIVDIVEFAKTRFSVSLPASELHPANLESIGALTALMERFRQPISSEPSSKRPVFLTSAE
jgi:acyl carrier protein